MESIENESYLSERPAQELSSSDNPFADIDSSDFEEAYDEATLDTVAHALQQAALKPQGMEPIILTKDGVSGLYAKRVHQSNGQTQTSVVYHHNDGNNSEEIKISNDELFKIMAAYLGGLAPEEKRSVQKIIDKIRARILDYWDGTVLFDMNEVIKSLIEKFSSLPVDKTRALNVNVVYSAIVKKATDAAKDFSYCWISRKGYYAFPPKLFNELAEEFGMKTLDFVKYLQRNSLLYLQGSSVGYQCNIKSIGNCYCIRTLKTFQSGDIDPLGEGDIGSLL